MDEKTFIEQLAAEVEKREEKRIKQLVAWCRKTAETLQQCHGIADVQRVHALATTGALFSAIRDIEITGELPPMATCDVSHFTENELIYVMYSFSRNNEKRTITISPTVMEIVPGQITAKTEGKRSTTWQIEPLVLEMDPKAVIPESIIALS